MSTVTPARIPASALVLGLAGLIPFILCAAASLLTEGLLQAQAWYALTAYGAVILSFLGGVHWGLAIKTEAAPKPAALTPRLIISVIPSLIGWTALLMPTVPGLIALALGFAAMLWTDLRATRDGLAPQWYSRLRWPLSIIVVLCLLIGSAI